MTNTKYSHFRDWLADAIRRGVVKPRKKVVKPTYAEFE